jgi:hypothetical protein
MTAFSYAVSAHQEQQFREPEILHALTAEVIPALKHRDATADGWALHYTAGLMFGIAYDRLWRKTQIKPTVLSGILLGGLSGLLGVAVWKTVLRFHPDPPPINRGRFFGHLLPAHVIFGVTAAMAYRMTAMKRSRGKNNG